MSDLATNKRALYDYEVLERLEAGVELLGHEVKAAKTGRAKLAGSFVHFRGGEAWLTNCSIARYAKASGLDGYDPTRSRRLLLSKRDIARLVGKHDAQGVTVVPLRLYVKRGLIKVEIALARGKRQYEKRETIKKRDVSREMRRARMV